MKVKLLQAIAGPTVNLDRGDEYECDPDEGQRLIDAGIAEPLEAPKAKSRESKVKSEKRG